MSPNKIYVLGTSYCGSTLLSMLLNQVPGVVSPGEAHWLIDKPEMPCTIHGDSCDMTSMLRGAQLFDEHLYDQVFVSIGKPKATTFVSTDKLSGHAQRFLRPGQATAIVLFKRPEAAALSAMNHLEGCSAEAVVELYSAAYENMMQFSCSGFFRRSIVVSYEKLATAPDSTIKSICMSLGLPMPQFTPNYRPVDWHNVGGNVSCYSSPRYAQTPIVVDERWKAETWNNPATIARMSARAQTIYNKMLNCAI